VAVAEALHVSGARKRFGQVDALAGASFDVHAGELVGLLGPNGAGKTTLIRAISGRVRLDAGTIQVFGRTLTPADPRPDIGIVPQELAIYPKLTARENLEVFARLYGVDRARVRERVEWALDWADLRDRSKEPALRFSGGMKRRLNIACGLLHSPSIVLLDEPTVGVDPQSRERIYVMLTQLRTSGVSIVLTTHHLEEAEQRCERIVIIDHGSIVASGTLMELVRSTLGDTRRVTVTLDRDWPSAMAVPASLQLSDDRRAVRVDTSDLSAAVPSVFAVLAQAGVKPADVKLTGATLHEVFIALTGRELRE
jgi:ABC-2 type transport system ATP-binding protein